MPTSHRHSGGTSSKRGTRYEDFFVVYRLLEYIPQVLETQRSVRIKEQANCPVDDVVLEEPARTHYHQLKSSEATTWGQDDGKLEREFREQQQLCLNAKQSYSLYLVAPTAHRVELLRQSLPAALRGSTDVILFPIMSRPSELVNLQARLATAFSDMRASRFASRTADEAIAGAVLLAYAEHVPDSDGFCLVSQVIDMIRIRRLVSIRDNLSITDDRWPVAVEVLQKIMGLEWWTDRGYFEWSYKGVDRGIFPDDVRSETFSRFVGRLLTMLPTTFEAFEVTLP